MEKEINTVGLSRDFIIHPGETLAEILEDRGMSQKELAIRTGVTEKHVSTVINGQKNISTSFAKKLEYALGIEAEFWINLQKNYERELLEFEEVNGISTQEIDVLKNLKEVVVKWIEYGWIEKDANPASMVLDIRKLFGISNLCDTPKMKFVAAFRAQKKNTSTDPYVLFAWQRMCELLTENIDIADEINIELLRAKIPEIKQVMFMDEDQIPKNLTRIFAECGIAFKIVPNFKGAPVQGFIKTAENGALILCVTLRQHFADIFWFSLFHEISHVLNGDTKNAFVDFDSVSGKIEEKADEMAKDLLLDPAAYKEFIQSRKYTSSYEIDNFAEQQGVLPFIVSGRLMKEGLKRWSTRSKYNWAV